MTTLIDAGGLPGVCGDVAGGVSGFLSPDRARAGSDSSGGPAGCSDTPGGPIIDAVGVPACFADTVGGGPG